MYAFGICVHKKLVCCVHRKILWTQILEFVSTKNCVDVSTGRFCGHRFGICVHKKLVCRIHLKVLWTQNREIVSTTCVHMMNIMKSDPMRNGNSVLADILGVDIYMALVSQNKRSRAIMYGDWIA